MLLKTWIEFDFRVAYTDICKKDSGDYVRMHPMFDFWAEARKAIKRNATNT